MDTGDRLAKQLGMQHEQVMEDIVEEAIRRIAAVGDRFLPCKGDHPVWRRKVDAAIRAAIHRALKLSR